MIKHCMICKVSGNINQRYGVCLICRKKQKDKSFPENPLILTDENYDKVEGYDDLYMQVLVNRRFYCDGVMGDYESLKSAWDLEIEKGNHCTLIASLAWKGDINEGFQYIWNTYYQTWRREDFVISEI